MHQQDSVEPNLIDALIRTQRSPKGVPHLNLEANIATAEILATLAGNGTLPAEAFNVLIERNRTLNSAPDAEILDSLTRQSTLLENLWLHFAARATAESRADQAAALMKAALNCQRALGNVLGTVHHLNEDKRNAEVVAVA